ncbi:MAG: hypothetical protein U0R52_00750 [Solirubrobacterales bacterium]
MARALIVGCGCRGTSLGRALAGRGWAVRGTSRTPAGVARIEAAGLEGAPADPLSPGTVLDLVGDVTVLCLLLGSISGKAAGVRAIHDERLGSLLEKLVDTPVRGIVYEAAGSSPPEVLETGAGLVRRARETWRIPARIVAADPADTDAWTERMLDAVAGVLTGNDG